MGSTPLQEPMAVISGASLAWTVPLCSPSLADLGDEVYYSPGVLLVNSSSVTAVLDGSVAVSVSATSGILSVLCSLPDGYRNSTRGLLGEGSARAGCKFSSHSKLDWKLGHCACEGRDTWV